MLPTKPPRATPRRAAPAAARRLEFPFAPLRAAVRCRVRRRAPLSSAPRLRDKQRGGRPCRSLRVRHRPWSHVTVRHASTRGGRSRICRSAVVAVVDAAARNAGGACCGGSATPVAMSAAATAVAAESVVVDPGTPPQPPPRRRGSWTGRRRSSSSGSVSASAPALALSQRRSTFGLAPAMEEGTCELRLRVIAGHQLAKKDIFGASDPYVKIDLNTVNGDETIDSVLTKTKKKTLNPQWNEEFIFRVRPAEHKLVLQVFDENRLTRDDFLGMVEVPLNNLPKEQEGRTIPPKQHILRPRRLGVRSRVKGHLELYLAFIREAALGPESPHPSTAHPDSTDGPESEWELVESEQTSMAVEQPAQVRPQRPPRRSREVRSGHRERVQQLAAPHQRSQQHLQPEQRRQRPASPQLQPRETWDGWEILDQALPQVTGANVGSCMVVGIRRASH